MDTPYQVGPDIHVLPTSLPLPGVGILPVNAYVIRTEEPVLVDSGIGLDSDDFMDALASIVDPAELRWIWLTHDDADHTGSIRRVMAAAPRARLVTNAFAALRMATWWPVPLDRVHAIRVGDAIDAGDRTLRAVAPPLFDNPLSIGVLDESTGALFTVDAFGAILPAVVEDVADVEPEALAGGMLGWATSDSPWAHLVDRERFGQVLARVQDLQPTRILSSHLPAASGDALGHLLQVLERVPDAEPFVPPGYEQFGHLLAALAHQAEPVGASA
jgi:glyoxylase-like metal-dependent hydrolase (beta-lactamase superfamily II)